jgi:hypothetical protein
MSADPRYPTPDVAVIAREFSEIRRRLDTLEAPSGTQAFRAVAKLQESISAIVQPAVISAIENDAAVAAVAADFAPASVVVPEGYTRALVNVTASASLRSDGIEGGWALLMVTAVITGATAYTNWSSVDGQKYGFGVAANAAVLEGLAAGDTVDVACRVSFPEPVDLAIARVAGSVLFLR